MIAAVASEYDPLVPERWPEPDGVAERDFAAIREHFATASRPFLSSPWTWLGWAVILPTAAVLTPRFTARPGSVLFLWSVAILAGGLVEFLALRRRRVFRERTPIASWALNLQGNLSLVGLVLSVVLVVAGRPDLLPGLWCLVLGHSFFALGGLAFRPMRTAGLLFQLGGVASFLPGVPPLLAFAISSAVACAWLAWGVARRPA